MIERAKRVVVFVVLHPKLACDVDRFAGKAAFADGLPYFAFVEVACRRVDHPIAGFQGIQNTALGVTFSNLVDAEADRGHHDAVVQTYFLHL